MIDKHFYKDEILRTIKDADKYLNESPMSIVDSVCENSPGTKHDYYSNGDYWWPNPDTKDSLPYVRKDGESYPGAFSDHRKILVGTACSIGALTAAYIITKDNKYLDKAIKNIKKFFISPKTKMNPSLLYAQAIPGICTGRGIGIIDTLHLIDTAVSIKLLLKYAGKNSHIGTLNRGVKWFKDYLNWMFNHPYGKDEINTVNNHSVCFCTQAATFAHLTGNKEILDVCKKKYREFLNEQLASDGSFPKELARTKPYGYSLFTIDNLVTLAVVLSRTYSDIFDIKGNDGQSLKTAIEFIYPYIVDKSTWDLRQDISHFDALPIGFSFLLFSGLVYKTKDYTELWLSLPHKSPDKEIQRNTAIKYPLLWVELFNFK